MTTTTADLINTGILMGIIHVLSGPDHLSALATLSGTNTRHQTPGASFLLGIKWGLGHSFGLLIVGGIIVAMEEESNEWIGMDSTASKWIEGFVGVFMLCLGCYGLHKACRNRRDAAAGVAHDGVFMTHTLGDSIRNANEETVNFKDANGEISHRRKSMEIIEQMSDILNRDGDDIRGSGSSLINQNNTHGGGIIKDTDDVEQRILRAAQSLRRNSSSGNLSSRSSGKSNASGDIESCHSSNDPQFMMSSLTKSAKGALSQSFINTYINDRPASTMKAAAFVHTHAAPGNSIALDHDSTANRCRNRCSLGSTPGILAIAAGIIHGAAGPGGVLGVIPAVQLRNGRLAFVYLSTFCLTSTLVMGGFAAFYARFSGWLAGGAGSRAFLVEVGSAFLSFAVGVAWLVLLSVGKLEDIFP